MNNANLFILIFLSPLFAQSQISKNIELLDNWQDNSLMVNSSQVRYNDCWGFVKNDQEYAIAGSTEGVHFFGITESDRFEQLDFVSGKYSSSMVIHRDIKVYGDYAYAVCDEGESSLQIINLSYLPDSVHLEVENDSTFARVHNLFIDTENALMYACLITPKVNGVLQSQRPMEVYSLADPLNPLLVYSGPNGIAEVHDAFVSKNIAYLNCGFDGLRIYDFTTPSNPSFLQNLNIYQDQGYNHQGWLSPDGSKYVFGDETNGKQLKNCSVNAINQVVINNRFGTNYVNSSVAHNIMLSNEFAYVAYYNEGLRIYDIRETVPKEIAHYDTYLEDSPFKMEGAWGIFSQLPSGRLIVSDRQNGLFLLDFREDIFAHQTTGDYDLFPNPVLTGNKITIKVNGDGVNNFSIQLFNLSGQLVFSDEFNNQTYAELEMHQSSGMYLLKIKHLDYLGDEIMDTRKIIIH